MNRPRGVAMQERRVMLSNMPSRFKVYEFAVINRLPYKKAWETLRSMVDCNMLRKEGKRETHIYIKRT